MYNNGEKILIWLDMFEFISLKKKMDIIEHYTNLTDLWTNFEKDKSYFESLVGEENYTKMLFSWDDNFLNNYIRNFENMGINIVTIKSDSYPKLLKETLSPPILLYCKGDIKLLKTTCVAVVGTRRMSKYGKEITYKFTFDIANAGITIVSGLADGVDSEAHKATLDAKGKTIAVLGCGINTCYPATNQPLYERILSNGGLIVSEYKPNDKVMPFHFPARNRIIAGLSKGVLITEATEKSGSMHTKEYALENNRDLFVVPGRITDIYSKGCNAVIKNCQSVMCLSADEIINAYGKDFVTSGETTIIQTNMDEQIILDILKTDEVHYDEILEKSGMEPKSLNTLLMRMDLKGIIKKTANYYSK